VTQTDVRLEESWKARLIDEFTKPYMVELKAWLKAEYAAKKTIYPRGTEYFAALDLTPFEHTKVVILGQDPYHGPNQAHGLSFSVKPGVEPPPSLMNMYRELKDDLGIAAPDHGCLEAWARQGVLLLNSVLTVERGRAASHAGKGWETFTDRIISVLNAERQNLAFVLWGTYAQKKGGIIDRKRHLVISAPHPSPLSASRGFFGSKPYSRINRYLTETGQAPIDWRLPAVAGAMDRMDGGEAIS
jgi:uracil-DNA glycosylase